MNYHYWDLIPPFKMPNLIWGGDNVYHRNCNAIKEQLCEHNIKARVSRHRLFDNDLFLLDVSDNKYPNRPTKRDIADALNIPVDWVGLYQCTEDLDEYAVLEYELIRKWGDCHKELHFQDEFDFMKVFKGSSNGYNISQRLKKKGICVNGICANWNCVTLNSDSSSDDIAEALNIPKIAVSDLRCHNADITHIILIDRCKE